MPLFTGSAALTGTSATDFLFGTVNADIVINGGDGGDLIIGDFNVNGVQTASTGNTTFATAYNIDAAQMWLDLGADAFPFVQSGGPFTTIYVEGENAYEVYSFTVGANETISIDIDYANFDSSIKLYSASDLEDPVASNDDGESLTPDIGAFETTESFLAFTTAADGAGVYYLVIGEFEDEDEFSTLEVGDETIVNVSVTGHAATGTITATNDTLNGGAGNDYIFGSGGDDIISGGDGFNHLDGGDGIDIADFSSWTFGGVFVNLSVQVSQNTRPTSPTFSGVDILQNFEGVTGTAFTDFLTGRFEGDDIINGGGGNDNIDGRGGVDNIDGGAGDDRITMQGDSFATSAGTLDGGDGQDSLIIESLVSGQTLDLRVYTSFISIEILDWTAEAVAVQMNAEQATDLTLLVDRSSSGLSTVLEIFMDTQTTLDLSALTTSGFSAANADAIIVTGDSDDESIIGGSYGDTINGGAGDDIIEGGAGNDILDGGAGNDFLSFANLTVIGTTEGMSVNLSDGAILGFYTGVDAVTNFESVIGSNYDDVLTGRADVNTLDGGAGSDVLNGMGGADVLLGGEGDDFIDLDQGLADSGAVFDGGAGFDQLRISGQDRTEDLRDNTLTDIEDILIADMNLVLQIHADQLGAAMITAEAHTGNSVTLEVYAGDETVIDLSGLTLSGLTELGDAVRLIGDGDNETLSGTAGSDEIFGGAGDDTILIGLGDDILDGGAGANDTLSFAAYDNGDATGVTVSLSSGNTTITNAGSGTDTLSGFENLTGSAFDDMLSGEAGLSLTIFGGSGNDVFQSGGGTNSFYGEDGDDDFTLNTAALETGTLYDGGEGFDSLIVNGASGVIDLRDDMIVDVEQLVYAATTAASYTVELNMDQLGALGIIAQAHAGQAHTLSLFLGAETVVDMSALNVSGFTETGDTLRITGDGDSETITGSSGNDEVFGAGGDDVISGGAGTNTLDGGAGTDTLTYAGYMPSTGNTGVSIDLNQAVQTTSLGTDTISNFEDLIGSDFDDALSGTSGDNTLMGGLGDDALSGAGGSDIIDGGAGNDQIAISATDNITGSNFNGGDGVDTLYIDGVGGTQDLSNSIVSNVETIMFESSALAANVLLVDADQMVFSSVGTTDSLAGQSSAIHIAMGSTRTLDLSSLSLINFDQDGDYIQIDGDNTYETITGTSGRDIINAGGGRDSIYATAGADNIDGGSGNDTLYFNTEIASYDGSFDGGSGSDRIYFDGANMSSVDVTNVMFSNIEQIEFRPVLNLSIDAYVSASVVDSAVIEIDGSAQRDSEQDLFIVMDASDADLDLSSLYFVDWRRGSGNQNDLITVIGDDADNSIIGSVSVDHLQGEDGNDQFVIRSDDMGSFESDHFDGGAGTDELYIQARSGAHVFDLTGVTLVGIEALTFDALETGYDVTVSLLAAQINSSLASDTAVNFGGSDVYTLTISLDNETLVDLSGWSFTSVEAGQDSVKIYGDNDDEVITASVMNDFISAGSGDDTIFAGEGDDIILAGAGSDAMNGGAGSDIVDYSASSDGITIDLFDGSQGTGDAAGDTFDSIEIIYGTSGNNTFIANDDGTSFIGNGGSDRVSYENASAGVSVNLSTGSTNGAFASGDSFVGIGTLLGSAFADVFNGSIGADRLEGQGGDDTLNGRAGIDRLYGGNGNDNLNGGGDNDQLFGGSGDDVLNGSIGNDRLTGGAGADVLIGGTGTRDRAEYTSAGAGLVVNMSDVSLNTGDAAGDTFTSLEDLYGSSHADDFTGNGGVNWLYGRNGDDILNGAGGQDRIFGGNDDDTAYGGDAGDELQGGNGNDTLYGESGADRLIGDAGNDTLYGGTDNDLLSGGAGDDMLFGEDGDDRFFGGEGADVYNGGDGTDRADYTNAASAVGVNLLTGGFQGEASGDSYASIEWVFGSAFDDTITLNDVDGGRVYGRVGNDTINGGAGEDRLYGQGGDDTLIGNGGLDRLFGNDGNDTLDGGAFNDQLFGGSGADIFVFAQGYARDTIYDFEDGVDLIDASSFNSGQLTAALATAKQSGASTVLDFGNGDQIVLRDTDVSDITIDDFV